MSLLFQCHHSAEISFVPLVVESFGGWSREASEVIGYIQGQRLAIPTSKLSPTGSKNFPFTCGEECLYVGHACPINLPMVDGVLQFPFVVKSCCAVLLLLCFVLILA